MPIKVCVAGITGWTGRCVAEAILKSQDMQLTAGVARKSAGKDVADALGIESNGAKIYGDTRSALTHKADVFVDFTSAEAVRDNVLTAVSCGVSVIVGTSGLTAKDYADIEVEAKKNSVGVIACGNFSITAALAKHFSLIAAKFLPQWEIIDYASASKIDVPSGTVQELAEQMSHVRKNEMGRQLGELHGPVEARGAQIANTPVHSLRLPSYVISFETIFGLPNERLTIRHDSGSGAEPYVDGALLAIRKVQDIRGIVRGMDTLLFSEAT